MMTIRTTIRVGLHTTASGKTLSVYRCSTLGMQGVATDEDAIDYVRRLIANAWTTNRAMLLNCIDNLDYSIERETV